MSSAPWNMPLMKLLAVIAWTDRTLEWRVVIVLKELAERFRFNDEEWKDLAAFMVRPPYAEFRCTCGVAICRVKMTDEDWRNRVLWDRYKGHFSPYLEHRIDTLKRARAPRCTAKFAKTLPLD